MSASRSFRRRAQRALPPIPAVAVAFDPDAEIPDGFEAFCQGIYLVGPRGPALPYWVAIKTADRPLIDAGGNVALLWREKILRHVEARHQALAS